MSRALIRNANVVDVRAGALQPPQSIAILNGRFADPRDVPETPDTRIIDAAGTYLCPGLIDCHVHLFLDAGSDPLHVFLRDGEEAKLRTAMANARLALSAGITTVCDCGGPADLVFLFGNLIDRGYATGPRILAAGSPLTRPGGHCHFFGIEIASRSQVISAVESQARRGAAFVKLIASGGGLTPGTSPAEADLPAPLMSAAVEVAHANGMHVTAHCHATESIVRALDAGVDIIEHATFARLGGPPAFDRNIALRIAGQGTIVSPTAVSGILIARSIRESGTQTSSGRQAIRRLEARRRHLGNFQEASVRLIGGTDCGVTNVPFDSLARELREYVDAGMSCAAALRTATCDSAEYLRQPTLGEIRQGFLADLLFLRENPLRTIDALTEPILVIKDGCIVHDRRPSPRGIPSASNADFSTHR